jgi:membrane protease YdiL (CAAX protease family)
LPLAVRVLYGGVTEEVLIRWGLMTALAWAAWRLFGKESPGPSGAMMWSAVVLSALVFGLSHVPAVAGLLGEVPASLAAYVTIGNAVFGVVAGYLFWRYGLEAAIGAHVLAHVFAYAIRS